MGVWVPSVIVRPSCLAGVMDKTKTKTIPSRNAIENIELRRLARGDPQCSAEICCPHEESTPHPAGTKRPVFIQGPQIPPLLTLFSHPSGPALPRGTQPVRTPQADGLDSFRMNYVFLIFASPVPACFTIGTQWLGVKLNS